MNIFKKSLLKRNKRVTQNSVNGKKAQQLLDLQNDTQLEKAVAVLSDVSKYKETLAGRD